MGESLTTAKSKIIDNTPVNFHGTVRVQGSSISYKFTAILTATKTQVKKRHKPSVLQSL